MFHTLISYLSRFARLVLIVFALLVVTILVLFTIRSATDDDTGVVTETAVTTQSKQVSTDKDDTQKVAAAVTYDAEEGETQVVIVGKGPQISVTEKGNPQVLDEANFSEVTLDSSDTVTVITVDETGNLQTETGQVSSTATTSEVLPNTGLTDVMATTLGLMAISAALGSYVLARQTLTKTTLEINR